MSQLFYHYANAPSQINIYFQTLELRIMGQSFYHCARDISQMNIYFWTLYLRIVSQLFNHYANAQAKLRFNCEPWNLGL